MQFFVSGLGIYELSKGPFSGNESFCLVWKCVEVGAGEMDSLKTVA